MLLVQLKWWLSLEKFCKVLCVGNNVFIASNNTALISKIPYTVNDENAIIAPGLGKKLVSILDDEFYEEQAFPYLLPEGKFGHKTHQDIAISPTRYFNQRSLNFNQHFASDADYIFLRGLYRINTTYVHQ